MKAMKKRRKNLRIFFFRESLDFGVKTIFSSSSSLSAVGTFFFVSPVGKFDTPTDSG